MACWLVAFNLARAVGTGGERNETDGVDERVVHAEFSLVATSTKPSP